MYDGLPDACLALMPSDGSLIYIERGESGYHTSEWETGDPQKNRKIADFYNEKRGVTQAQEKAMLNGSLFGWDVPAADPKRYETPPSPEVNEGYEIVKRATVGEIEIVLGKSTTAPDMYVTWRRTPAHEHHGRPEYYWGHYFDKEYIAVEDFESRVESETLDSKESKSVSKKRHEPERWVKKWKRNNRAGQTIGQADEYPSEKENRSGAMKMEQGFIDYLAISPKGRRNYLNFIIDLADIAIKNAGSNGITEETVAKAKRCKADALRQLEHMKKEHNSPGAER